MYKTLLLDFNWQPLSLIVERRLIKLFFNEKVEVVSNWDFDILWEKGSIKHPSIVRLKKYINRNVIKNNVFSRRAVVKRDKSICQYCSKKMSAAQVTIDHIVPKIQGGGNSFLNCVVSCGDCNNVKAGRTPDQAGMKLIKIPIIPLFSTHYYIDQQEKDSEFWNIEWENYII